MIRICSERLENLEAEKWIAKAEEVVLDLKQGSVRLSAEYYFNFGLVKDYGGALMKLEKHFFLSKIKTRK